MIRILVLTTVLLLGTPGVLRAQEEEKEIVPGPWKLTSSLGLNLSQSAFSSNWAGGDKGSLVWVLSGDMGLERQFTERFHLSNILQLAYGQTAKQVADPNDPSGNVWERPVKTTDHIMAESTGRFTLGGFADPYVSVRLDSQFEDRSDPAGSIRLNPVKLTESAGIARVLEKTEDREAITRVGLGLRQTFRRYITEEGSRASFSTNDGGLEWQTTVTRPVLEKRVLYKGQLLVFVPFFFSQSGDLEDFDELALAADPSREEVAGFWKTPDVQFQNTFTAQLSKVLSVNLDLQFVYDKYDAFAAVDTSLDPAVLIPAVDRGIRKAGQFRENLSVGLTYRLF